MATVYERSLSHSDHLNTPRLVADATGTTVWRWDQAEPFGDSPANENPGGNSVAFNLPLRLPGQYYDAESGLHQNKFRDYDPALGSYKESDLIGLSGGVNTYAYTKGRPLRFFDPLGLFCISLWDDATAWQDVLQRGKPSYVLTGVVFSEIMGPIGTCLWVKTLQIEQKREVRSRSLCFNCDKSCGNPFNCKWEIVYGPWQEQRRSSTKTDRRSSAAFRIFSGNDIEMGDLWWCQNPWNGRTATGRMR